MPRILIIDDVEQVRTVIRRCLELEGHEVLDVYSAREGIKMYSAERPDLVITDILIPDKDGIELTTDLRKENPEVKIIAVSGGGGFTPHLYLTSSKYLGASLTLAKPFQRE